MDTKRPIIALSGGFNPARKNHVAMILDASKIGDVVIILNSDDWCKRHSWNNQLFSKYENREAILRCIPGVVEIIPAEDADDTVCKTLGDLKPDYFGNGGSRDMSNTPEVQLCKELGIGMMWYLGDTTDEKVLQKAEAYLNIAIAKVYHGE
jgi:glycerol-3-phosphate cytidylyltransferase-like family protein